MSNKKLLKVIKFQGKSSAVRGIKTKKNYRWGGGGRGGKVISATLQVLIGLKEYQKVFLEMSKSNFIQFLSIAEKMTEGIHFIKMRNILKGY